jgi:hypothetical protein
MDIFSKCKEFYILPKVNKNLCMNLSYALFSRSASKEYIMSQTCVCHYIFFLGSAEQIPIKFGVNLWYITLRANLMMVFRPIMMSIIDEIQIQCNHFFKRFIVQNLDTFSSVSVVTSYGLDNCSSIPARAGIFIFVTAFR